MKKDNYKAWDVKLSDFPKKGNIEDQIQFLTSFGILSANIHNTQPWLFDVQENKLIIYPNWEYQLRQADQKGKNLFISLGCCIKNIECAAAYYQFTTKITLLGKSIHETRIEIRFIKGKPDKDFAALALYITKRYSNKMPYEATVVEQRFVKKLLQVRNASEKMSLSFTNDRSIIQEIASLQEKAIKNLVSNKAFIRELVSWLRTNDTKAYDGMPGFVVGLKQVQARVSKLLIPYLPKATDILAKNDKKLLVGSPLIGTIAGLDTGIMSWINIGRTYEELALKAFSLNINITPMHSIIEDKDTVTKLAKLFVIKDKKKPQFFFRMGYSKNVSFHTPRRKIDNVFINDFTERKLAKSVSDRIEFKKVKIGKYLINYIKVGKGQPLLLIHGGNIGWGQWYPNIAHYAKHFTVYAIDLPGSGRSTRVEFQELNFKRDLLDVVEEFIKVLGIKKTHVIASSISSWIVLKLASKDSSLFDKIIIADAIGLTDYLRPPDKLIAFYPLARMLEKTILKPDRHNKQIEGFIRSVFHNSHLNLQTEFIDYFYETMRTSHNLLFISKMSHTMLTSKDLLLGKELKKIKNDILVVWGEFDKLIPFEKVENKITILPHTTIKLISNASHIPSLENSVEFNESTQKFLLKG